MGVRGPEEGEGWRNEAGEGGRRNRKQLYRHFTATHSTERLESHRSGGGLHMQKQADTNHQKKLMVEGFSSLTAKKLNNVSLLKPECRKKDTKCVHLATIKIDGRKGCNKLPGNILFTNK